MEGYVPLLVSPLSSRLKAKTCDIYLADVVTIV